MIVDVEPYFMENDDWWYVDEEGQARLKANAPMKAKKSYWKWIGSEPMPFENKRGMGSLMYFRYEVWSMRPMSLAFERSGSDVFVEVEKFCRRERYSGCVEDMERLAALVERHGLLSWPRVSRRPEDLIICDGAMWTVKFVFADGVMHMRRGETGGEPDAHEAFVDELEGVIGRVVARG